MKRRIIKKWIKRYLNPLVEHLPRTVQWDWNNDMNITLINGERKKEGEIIKIEYNPKRAIQMQSEGILSVLEEFKNSKIYVRQINHEKIGSNQRWELLPENQRKNPKMKFYGIRMRFIIEKVNL